MRPFASLLIALCLVALAGCTPESRHGLPESFRVAPDARFIGAWRGGNEAGALQGAEVVARLRADPAEPLDLLMTAEERWRTTRGDHSRTLLGRLRFYNVASRQIVAIQRLDADGKANSDQATWRFATYRFGGDDGIALYFMDEEQLRWRIFNGVLPGKIRGGEPEFPDLLITADSDKLAALIRTTNPAVMFTARLGPFVRER